MKKRILIFISGILVGCIITTAGFLIFGRTNRMPRDRMPIDQNGEFTRPENMGERPEFHNKKGEEKITEETNTVN